MWASPPLPPKAELLEITPILMCLREHFNLLFGCHWNWVGFLFLLNVTFLLFFVRYCPAVVLGEVLCCDFF